MTTHGIRVLKPGWRTTAVAAALACLALGVAPGARASSCGGRAPSSLHLARLAGTDARLSWRIAAGARGAVYRVLRGGRVVGQTSGASIVLRVTPGRLSVFTVQARWRSSAAMCAAALRMRVPFRAPGRPARLRVLALTAGGAVLGWRPASRGDAPLAGYRVERDGAVVGQTPRLRFSLRLSAGRAHTVKVLAVDTRGHVGVPRTLVVPARPGGAPAGSPPSTPGALSASEISSSGATLWWLPSTAGGARLAGYRVYRDGALVGESAQTSMRLGRLSFPHTYEIAVAAVDADGRQSAPTAPLALSTSHTPPDGPALLSAVRVTDTSATLSWQEGSASEASVVGYELFKDGQEVGVFKGQSATVALASGREYVFAVRTLDSYGYLSAPSPSLKVLTTHTPPSTPTGLSAEQVSSQSATLTWSPSTAVSGNIVGYRVFRDEIPVGQTPTPSMTINDLAPSSEYEITVTAVDSAGAISPPTAPLTIHTAPPAPSTGTVQAYLLASVDQSFADLQAHYQQIGVLYPTYFNCGAGGEVTGADDPLVTKWALAREIAVMPRVNCQNVADEDQVLNEPAASQTMISELAGLCETYGYDGVQIDFEGAQPSERAPFTAFITALAARLHSQGDRLSTVVTAKYYNVQTGRAAMYDDAALSAVSDYVFVLDWGLHWTTSAPGSIDELPWFRRVAEYTATMPNRSRFILGMPLYGIDWPNDGGPSNPGTPMEFAQIHSLQSELGVTPEWESTAQSPHFSYVDEAGVPHQVWYVDEQSIAQRASLAASLGLGVGLWRLGEEDQSIWELAQLGG